MTRRNLFLSTLLAPFSAIIDKFSATQPKLTPTADILEPLDTYWILDTKYFVKPITLLNPNDTITCDMKITKDKIYFKYKLYPVVDNPRKCGVITNISL